MKAKSAAGWAAAVVLPGGLLVGAGALVWQLLRRRRVQALTDKLREGLPMRMEQWAPQIAAAAYATAPAEFTVERWAFTFAGIVDRESGGGVFLTTGGPDGTGDGGHGHGLGQVDDRPAKSNASEYEQRLSVKRLSHLAGGDWTDPARHLLFCAREVLRGAYDQFSDVDDAELRLQAAVAAYNAGVDNVRRQLDAGADVNAVTTKGAGGVRDYSADVLARAGKWTDAAEGAA